MTVWEVWWTAAQHPSQYMVRESHLDGLCAALIVRCVTSRLFSARSVITSKTHSYRRLAIFFGICAVHLCCSDIVWGSWASLCLRIHAIYGPSQRVPQTVADQHLAK